jgi:oligopeptidase A
LTANNPALLQAFDLPPYSAIRAEHVEPAVDSIQAESRTAMTTWRTTVWHAGMGWCWRSMNWARLGRSVGHVPQTRCSSAELRSAYRACPSCPDWTELARISRCSKHQALASSPAALALTWRKPPFSSTTCVISAYPASTCRQRN